MVKRKRSSSPEVQLTSVDRVLKLHSDLRRQFDAEEELDVSQAALFHTISLGVLDPLLKEAKLPPAKAFSGTPTIAKLSGYLVTLKELTKSGNLSLEEINLISCTRDIAELYICALCLSLREMEPPRKRFKPSTPYVFNDELTSGVDEGLICLQDTDQGRVRKLFREQIGCQVFTMTELTDTLARNIDKFSSEFFHSMHDIKIVPKSTSKLLRFLHNNPNCAFYLNFTALYVLFGNLGNFSFIFRICASSYLSSLAGAFVRGFFGTQ